MKKILFSIFAVLLLGINNQIDAQPYNPYYITIQGHRIDTHTYWWANISSGQTQFFQLDAYRNVSGETVRTSWEVDRSIDPRFNVEKTGDNTLVVGANSSGSFTVRIIVNGDRSLGEFLLHFNVDKK